MKHLTNSGACLILIFALGAFQNDIHNQTNKHYETSYSLQMTSDSIQSKEIVLMGNSITEGWFAMRPEYFKGKPFVNKGISGQTTYQMLERFKSDVIDLKPDAVVILAGVNDIAENGGTYSMEATYSNIIEMVQMAREKNIKVALSSILPASDFPWRPGLQPAEKIVRLNGKLSDYATSENLVFIDYFSEMKNSENGLVEAYGYDGVHPNETGYRVMEPLLAKAVSQLFK